MADVTGRSLRAELGGGELDLAGLKLRVLAERDSFGNTVRAQAWLSKLSSSTPGLRVHAPELTASVDSEQHADGTQLTHFSAVIPALLAEGRNARLTSAALARGTLCVTKTSRKNGLI